MPWRRTVFVAFPFEGAQQTSGVLGQDVRGDVANERRLVVRVAGHEHFLDLAGDQPARFAVPRPRAGRRTSRRHARRDLVRRRHVAAIAAITQHLLPGNNVPRSSLYAIVPSLPASYPGHSPSNGRRTF